MAEKFYKGRTNNHLTWVMVDATDFATPESALSAATKIKIWGKLRGATGVNFVSSGTGSLTNDIQHVGPSVLGIYTIALAKADLSDASAAWYDQYIISLSAAGAAYQALIADGGIDESTISALISDVQSAVAVANSRVLLNESRISDVYSLLSSRITSVIGTSSDLVSKIWANAIATRIDSRVLVIQSIASDVRSQVSDLQSDFQSRVPKLVASASQVSDLASDLKSAIGGITVTLSASDISDIASAVAATAGALTASEISDIASAVWAHAVGARVDSRILVIQSIASDVRSQVSDLQSDFQSRVPKLVATNSQLSDLASDVKSAIAGITAGISASDISDIASAVWAHAIGARVDSRVLVLKSDVSDIVSAVAVLPAAKLAAHAAAVGVLVVGSGSTTITVKFSTVDGGAPSSVNDFYNGRVIIFTSGALAQQATSISDYDGATTTATVVGLTGAPANAVTAVIV